jgi:hypothetical protein
VGDGNGDPEKRMFSQFILSSIKSTDKPPGLPYEVKAGQDKGKYEKLIYKKQ